MRACGPVHSFCSNACLLAVDLVERDGRISEMYYLHMCHLDMGTHGQINMCVTAPYTYTNLAGVSGVGLHAGQLQVRGGPSLY